MVNVIATAAELGYINVPDNTLIDIEQLNNYPPEADRVDHHRKPGRVHGSSVPYGSRICTGRVHIMPGDTVIFSSNPIPGNEKAVSKVINELSCQGCQMLFSRMRMYPDMHARRRSS